MVQRIRSWCYSLSFTRNAIQLIQLEHNAFAVGTSVPLGMSYAGWALLELSRLLRKRDMSIHRQVGRTMCAHLETVNLLPLDSGAADVGGVMHSEAHLVTHQKGKLITLMQSNVESREWRCAPPLSSARHARGDSRQQRNALYYISRII